MDVKYTVQDKITSGGFGTVFGGTMEKDGETKEVVFKIINAEAGQKIYKGECNQFALINKSKFLIEIYDCINCVSDKSDPKCSDESLKNKYIVVLEKMDTDLRTFLLAIDIKFSLLIDICLRIAYCVQFIHKRGYWHTDIKPPNIMINNKYNGDYELKLIDLGTISNKSISAGTPGFEHPYQYDSRRKHMGMSQKVPFIPKDGRYVDIYQLGTTFFDIFVDEGLQIYNSGENVNEFPTPYRVQMEGSPLPLGDEPTDEEEDDTGMYNLIKFMTRRPTDINIDGVIKRLIELKNRALKTEAEEEEAEEEEEKAEDEEAEEEEAEEEE